LAKVHLIVRVSRNGSNIHAREAPAGAHGEAFTKCIARDVFERRRGALPHDCARRDDVAWAAGGAGHPARVIAERFLSS
jgi:hypothetical protein